MSRRKIDFDNIYSKGVDFLKLYKKYLLEIKMAKMEEVLNNLPTNVIERAFEGVEFFTDKKLSHEQIDNRTFGFNGLCGYGVIEKIERELLQYTEMGNSNMLDIELQRLGFKINKKYIGYTGAEI